VHNLSPPVVPSAGTVGRPIPQTGPPARKPPLLRAPVHLDMLPYRIIFQAKFCPLTLVKSQRGSVVGW
jgi:hypothetical protein